MATTAKTPTLDQQISQLESEINSRQRDIELLRDALEAVEQNQPRPQQPDADSIHALLTKMIGSVPKTLEQQKIYSAKLEAAKTSLQLAINDCRKKSDELQSLCQQRQEQQQVQPGFLTSLAVTIPIIHA